MRFRFAPKGAVLAVLLAALAACDDDPPTLTGDENFPGGRPVTLEARIPASVFFRQTAIYSGYTDQNNAGFLLVANQFGGAGGLSSHGLLKFQSFPDTITFTQDGTTRIEAVRSVTAGRLVVLVDSGASVRQAPTTVELYRVAQDWDPGSAGWELAVDTGAVEIPWVQPGGTRGALVAQATYTGTGTDSLFFQLDSASIEALRDTLSPGLLLRTAEAGTRLQIRGVTLSTSARPQNAVRDTTLALNVESGPQTFVFTPQPPSPAGTLQAGGILSARTVFGLELDDLSLPGCATGQVCDPVTLREVSLNRVSLLLRPVDVPNGFTALEGIPLAVRTVPEPELGRRAPLGDNILDPDPQSQQIVVAEPGDTLVEIPITAYVFRFAAGDTLPTTFALLSEDVVPGLAPPTFGVGLFRGDPLLRVVYTLPVRPRLP